MQFQSQLARDQFEKYVLEVANATLEKGGAVSKLETYQLLPPSDDWKFPKYPNKTVILPPEIDLVEELKKFILAVEFGEGRVRLDGYARREFVARAGGMRWQIKGSLRF